MNLEKIIKKKQKLCHHQRRKNECIECGGSSICKHNHRKCINFGKGSNK